jgi:group I intron endonuclease
MKSLSGIYEILNSVNGHRYIGSTTNTRTRWNRHLSFLRSGNHHSKHLQYAWTKYGEENFIFSVLEVCDSDNLFAREQFYIDEIHPEYNMAPIARSCFGIRRSEETKRKMSNSAKGKIKSAETCQRISASKKGQPSYWKGKTHSDEYREKLSKAHKGVPLSASHRASLSAVRKGRTSPMKGKHHSEETKKKLSNATKLWRNASKEEHPQ